jgi:two-component system sensor histidine kinase/response regulator
MGNIFSVRSQLGAAEPDGHVLTNIALINGMSMLAVGILLVFSFIYAVFLDNVTAAMFELTLAVAVLFNMLMLRRHGNVRLASRLLLGCSVVLLVFLLITGGADKHGPYWTLFFPLVAYHLCGRACGSKWILLFAGIFAAFLVGVAFGALALNYPDVALRNAFVLYLTISLLAHLYELKHERDEARIRRQVEELQRKEEALKAARDEAVEAARFRSQFLANMSHEIRTPMNAVVGMTELLLDTDLSDEQNQCARIVHDAGNSLLGIINDILDLSKLESGMFHLVEEDFCLHSLVEDVCDLMASQAHNKGLELVCHIEPDVPDAVEGDEGRLRQVLMNLVGNAVKFTAEGEVVVSVDADEVTPDAVSIRLRVRDTGMGMSEEVRSKLFTPFYQADSAMTRKHNGTGLGLAVSQRLVELMDGSIEVESAPGAGATFMVRVALQRQEGGTTAIIRKFPSVHALVVDDNETNRMILRRQVASLEMEVATAASAAEALSILRHDSRTGRKYGLIITDMQMPLMDGMAFAAAVRDDPDLADIPIIVLSSISWSARQSRNDALVDGMLTKPVRFNKLVERISHILDRGGTRALKVSQEASAEAAGVPVTNTGVTVLVAEDNRVNRKVIEKQLDKLGFACEFAENGVRVLEMLRETDFPVVLMDCEMPEMDGFDACRRIRSGEAGESIKDLPVIAMTAHVMDAEQKRCFDAGMNDYLSKPVKLDALRDTLNRWLNA